MTKQHTIAHERRLIDTPLGSYLTLFALFYIPILAVVYPLPLIGLGITLLVLTAAFQLL